MTGKISEDRNMFSGGWRQNPEFQQVWGRRPEPPAITVAFVSGLANPDFLVEMDAVAVVPQ